MAEMTAVEALNRAEELLQNLSVSLPAHMQLKQVIGVIREEHKRSIPKSEDKSAPHKKKKR